MLFVGRESEKKKIIKSLKDGKNIILGGKFGIGRTSLMKRISEIFADKRKFIFIDFSKTPGKMSEKLIRELELSARFKKTGEKMGYKAMRYCVAASASFADKPIIVFDNIAKLTGQKIIFLRYLIQEDHFQFIAIVENFLPPRDLAHLRAHLLPADVLSLRNLKMNDVLSFMRIYSQKHTLNLSDKHIHELAGVVHGYPLNIIELIKNISKGAPGKKSYPATNPQEGETKKLMES